MNKQSRNSRKPSSAGRRTALRVQSLDERIVPSAAPRVAAYYPEWGIYGRNYQVADVPADKVSHLIYAFANVNAAGSVSVFDSWAAIEKPYPTEMPGLSYHGNFNQLQLLKQANPNLRTMIAIGGWTLSDYFSDVASTQATRNNFANSAVTFMKQYGFDGVDIDWEYPVSGGEAGNHASPADKHNFTLLMQALSDRIMVQETLDNRQYDIAAAVAAGDGTLQNYEMVQASQYVDWFDLMSYDYHGSGWEANATNHQAALFNNPANPFPGGLDNVDWSMSQYLAAGVPAEKLQIGVPLYDRAWKGVPATNHGLYQSATGMAVGTWEDGVIDYKDMYSRLQAQPAVYQKYFDATAGVPYVYSPTAEGGFFSTHEDTQSLALKVNYVTSHQLGGLFFWDLTSDLPATHVDSLLRRASAALTQASVQSIQVNDGSTQRSRITSLKVTFNNPVTYVTSLTAAYGLVGPGGTVIPLTSVTTTATTAVLNFASLSDGRYTLSVFGSQVMDPMNRPLDGNADGTPGGNATFAFHRLFGDANGDATVNGTDFLAFRLAFLTTNSTFDFDGDGQVNGNDFLQFRLRFLTSI